MGLLSQDCKVKCNITMAYFSPRYLIIWCLMLIRYPLPILEELLWPKQANQLCKLMGQTVDQVVAPTFIEHLTCSCDQDVVRWNKLDLQEPEMSQNEVLGKNSKR